MKRRTFLALGLAAAVAAVPAFAQSVTDLVVQQLQAAGFTKITISKTWLGRIRIVATNEEFRREIIIDPRTGEVLRDIWQNLGTGLFGSGLYDPDDDDSNQRRSGGSGSGSKSGSSNSGSSHDDDDDDDDDDHSGSGSSSSGGSSDD